MKKEFIRFIGAILIVLLGVLIVDYIVGNLLDNMLPKMPNNVEVGKTEFALNKVNNDVLIVGSSRAAHHYVTSMISDSLNTDAYNLGRDGCFFTYQCCVVNSVLERYTPKIIIWEVDFDGLNKSNNDPIESLYPYYDNKSFIRKTINESEGWKSKISMFFKMYRYNTTAIKIVPRLLSKSIVPPNDNLLGYDPIAPKKHIIPLKLEKQQNKQKSIDPRKVARFKYLISNASDKGINLVIVDSPVFYLIDNLQGNESKKMMEDICRQNNMPFIDNRQLENFLNNPDLFADKTHLNSKGAKIYTELFVEQLRSAFMN